MQEMKPNEINVELPEEIAEGIYANLAIITHSHSEFIIDFIRMMPNVAQAKVKSRMILTPQHAKRLMIALRDNLKKYEDSFGPIQDIDQGIAPYPMGFGGPTGQA
jgi:hypothetical protein